MRALVHSVRLQLPRSLPSLVSTALALLVTAEAVGITRQLLLVAHSSSPKIDALNANQPAPPVGARNRSDTAGIMAANLFGAREPPPVNTDPNAVPVSVSNLILTGTLARRNPKRGMAIVSTDGKSAMYRVGAALGGATVASIYKDRIILDRAGTLEALLMPHAKSPSDGSTGQAMEARTQAPNGSPDGLIADNAASLSEVMRAGGAVMNESGRMRGFRILPGKDRATFVASGLRGGDIVVAYNGIPVTQQDHSSGQQVFQSFSASAGATLTIERNGRTSDVTIDLAQAGSSMRALPTQAPATQPFTTAALSSATSVPDETRDDDP